MTNWNYDRCYELGCEGEDMVARVMGGTVTTNGHPVDVVTDKLAIEVKTFTVDALEHKASMGKGARRRKKQWARERGLRAVTVMVIMHPDHGDLYIAEGFKGFRRPWMKYLGSVPRQ